MSANKRRRGTLVAAAVLLVLVIVFSWFATVALRPPRRGYGCMWRSYLAEPLDSLDVLYLGTSVAYTNVSPAVVYRASGLTSFSLAGPVQSMTESYYYLREALRTQQPSLVMLDVTGLMLSNQPHYDFNNIDYMPAGLNKWRCALETAPAEDLIQYFFPLYVFHDRWNQVSPDQIKLNFSPAEPDPYAGWTCLEEITSFETYEPRLETWTEESFQAGADSLRKIVELCRQEQIELLLTMSPRCNTMTEKSAAKLQELLNSLDVRFVDFDSYRDEMQIDDLKDFFDNSHLNLTGADKFSRFLAEYFTEECGLTPRGGEDEELWAYRIYCYNMYYRKD